MQFLIERMTLMPLLRLWCRPAIGFENIPKEGPFILAANHSSYYETLMLPSTIFPYAKRNLHAFVNSLYFRFPIKIFLDSWGGIPVYLEGTKQAKEKNKASIKIALEYLRQGHIIMVFPEGKRSKDGKLQKAYSGIARLALNSKAPVLPVGVIGANKVLPKGKILPRFTRCDLKIGKPMHFDMYKKINKKTLEEVTSKIMKEIAKLIGQEYDY